MKLITILIVSIIGLAYCVFATPPTKQLYSVCRSTVDWLRTDQNALTYMKYDEEVSSDFIQLLESNKSTENICDMLAVRDTGNEFILGGLVRAVGAIIKASSRAGKVAKAGSKVHNEIENHKDRKRRHKHRHRKSMKAYAQLA